MELPFFREAGAGPGVVCLHANASSSSQWRALTDMLAPAFHVLAPDGFGAGKRFSLVGHSHGAAVANVQGWADALMQEPTPLAAFAALDMPVLLLTGTASPRSSRAVAQRLEATLPTRRRLDLAGLGHMGPVTHPDRVNAAIRDVLERA